MKTSINRIAIPTILEVGMNKLENTGSYLVKNGINKIVVCFGEGIKELFGGKLLASIKDNQNLCLLEEYCFDDIDLGEIMKTAFSVPSQTQAIVGIGGGKALDVAKYTAFLNNIPFISIPTSTAHDGFASSGCSLVINGRRTSVSANMPYGIIVDIGIIKNSPEKFIYSGIGDIVSKITAIYDWQFEEKHGKTVINDFAVMIAKKSVNSIARMPFGSIKEDFFIKELVDSLTMSGIAMEISGNSAPASGSEHLISHALDKMKENPQLHGIQVGIGTYIMSKVQEHRVGRVTSFLKDTGFFDYVATLKLAKKDFEDAVQMGPGIKPDRYTYLHLEECREKALTVIREDEILKNVLC